MNPWGQFYEAENVVLNSGGPLMVIESIEDGRALCRWTADGKIARGVFPLACLSRPCPSDDDDEWQER